jgi:hypothetical protein
MLVPISRRTPLRGWGCRTARSAACTSGPPSAAPPGIPGTTAPSSARAKGRLRAGRSASTVSAMSAPTCWSGPPERRCAPADMELTIRSEYNSNRCDPGSQAQTQKPQKQGGALLSTGGPTGKRQGSVVARRGGAVQDRSAHALRLPSRLPWAAASPYRSTASS